ncbi:MAG: phosphoglucomutase/phosphomannomutase family protein [Acidobacteriota bacterium]
MNTPLRFGTDGWRGVIGDAFTFGNLERVAAATASILPSGPVVIGHDHRFMAQAHADRVAEVFSSAGFEVLRVRDPLPTPALSGLVVSHAAAAGIMLTASHNPPRFGGFKIKLCSGGSAPEEFTRQVEDALDVSPVRRMAADDARAAGRWTDIDFKQVYRHRVMKRLDMEALSTAPPLTIVVDSMHGTGNHLIADFLRDTPHRVITLHGDRDVLFGGMPPEPVAERLTALRQAIAEHGADLGVANDGDADRVAAMDETGQFLSALRITPLLAHHLITHHHEAGDLARTTANTLLLDRIAAAHGRQIHVRPIGFKNLAPLLEDGTALIAGEESGGIGVAGYLPERDGLLMALLLLEARVHGGRPLSKLLAALWREYGEFHYRRLDLAVPRPHAAAMVADLAAAPPDAVAGLPVTAVDVDDGTKLSLGDAGWIMIRCSGTEPVLRVYCEARSPEEVEQLLDEMARRVTPDPAS